MWNVQNLWNNNTLWNSPKMWNRPKDVEQPKNVEQRKDQQYFFVLEKNGCRPRCRTCTICGTAKRCGTGTRCETKERSELSQRATPISGLLLTRWLFDSWLLTFDFWLFGFWLSDFWLFDPLTIDSFDSWLFDFWFLILGIPTVASHCGVPLWEATGKEQKQKKRVAFRVWEYRSKLLLIDFPMFSYQRQR